MLRDFENTTTDLIHSWGYVDFTRDAIVLREKKNTPPDQERITFLHEVIHVLDDTLMIGLEEEQVQQLAAGLITVITDNKIDFNHEKSK